MKYILHTIWIPVITLALVGAGCSNQPSQEKVVTESNTQTNQVAADTTIEQDVIDEESDVVDEAGYYEDSEYGFSFSYDETLILKERRESEDVYGINGLYVIDLEYPGEEEKHQSNIVSIAVIEASYFELLESIKSIDLLPTSTTLTNITDSKTLDINGTEFYSGLFSTAIGLNQRYYFTELDENTSLFLYSYEMNESDSMYQEIIDSLNVLDRGETTFKSDYGYSLTYDTRYEYADFYGLWHSNFDGPGVLENWGLNIGQETIMSLSVYDYSFRSKFETAEQEDTDLNGFAAYNTKVRDFWDAYLIEMEDYFIVIHTTLYEDEIYDQLLSSFRLTDASRWSSYSDEEFGFTLNYPATLGDIKVRNFEPGEYQNGHRNLYKFSLNDDLSLTFMSSDYALQVPATDFKVVIYSSLDFSSDENELADKLKAAPNAEIDVRKEIINGYNVIVSKQSYLDALDTPVEGVSFLILDYLDGKDVSISSKPSDEELIRQLIDNMDFIEFDNDSTEEADASDWLMYTNEEYGLSFQHPRSYIINDLSEANQRSNPSVKLLLGIRKENTHPSDHELVLRITSDSLEDEITRYESAENSEVIANNKITIGTKSYTELRLENQSNSFISRILLDEVDSDSVLRISLDAGNDIAESIVATIAY